MTDEEVQKILRESSKNMNISQVLVSKMLMIELNFYMEMTMVFQLAVN